MVSAGAFDPVRLARVTRALDSSADDDGSYGSLCVSSAEVAQVDGAGVVLIMHGRALGAVCSSSSFVEAVEEVQYSTAEGPCLEAFTTGAPVLVSDLRDDDALRWPGFHEGALAAGVGAAFCFPILIGTVCIGALDLYQRRPGALSGEQMADALAVAHVAGRTVLGWQSVAGDGSLARQLEHLPMNRAVVHQAAGMVSVQLSVNVDDALALLRAYAFSNNHPVGDVAAEVVQGDLRFG